MLFLPFLLTTATLGPVAVISLGKESLGPTPQPQQVAFCVCAPAVASHLPTPGPPQRPPPSPPACACSFSREQEARGEDPQASRAPWCPGRDCGARRFRDAKQKRRQPVGAAEGPRLLILLCLSFLSLFLLTEFSPGCRSDFHAVFLSSNFFFLFGCLGCNFIKFQILSRLIISYQKETNYLLKKKKQ